MSIHVKMTALAKAVGFIEFDGRNQQFGASGNNYATAAGVLRKINQAMGELCMYAVSHAEILSDRVIEHEDKNGKPVFSHLVVARETLTFVDAETGETVQASGVGSGIDRGDKSAMKASTAATKYAYAHALTLGWGAEDPEKPEEDDKPARAPRKAKEAPAETGPSAADLQAILDKGASPEAQAEFQAAFKKSLKVGSTSAEERVALGLVYQSLYGKKEASNG